MPLDENTQGLASSPEPVLDAVSLAAETDASVSLPEDTAAAPSAAKKDEPENILSVVRDVVARERQEAPEAAPSAASEEDGPKADPKASKEPDDENFSDVPFHTHPRFRQLLRQRDQFKRGHEQFSNVERFLDTHGLSADEAANMLVIGGLRRTDPIACWNALQPFLQDLVVAAGVAIPPDLQQRVAAGEMSEAAARELSQSRAKISAGQMQRTFEQQRETNARLTDQATQVVRAAEDWEADRRQKDPNFDQKLDPIMREVAFLQRTEGVPNHPDGVRDQLKRAYESVNASLRTSVSNAGRTLASAAAATRRPAVRPVMGGQVQASASPEPKSVLDIVRGHGTAASR